MSRGDFAIRAAARLSELYTAALNLPAVRPWRYNREARLTLGWEQVEAMLARLLGERDGYWEFFDPYVEEVVTTSLSDDLADIYWDVQEGLALYGNGSPGRSRDAVWVWRESFTNHWGAHLVDALRVLHRLAVESIQEQERAASRR